jgi:hypothetical protein
MKIGIGVITLGVRGINPRIHDLAPPGAEIVIQVDGERQGVAKTRNVALKKLYDAGCDYMFMFDDDCYPMAPGWADYFIGQSLSTGIQFFGLPEAFKSNLLRVQDEMGWWHAIVGCFSFQTRKAMDIIGYYNSAYNTYGYEDVARNIRAKRAGLFGHDAFAGEFPSPIRSIAYIHSEDVHGENPAPNLTHEEKMSFIGQNHSVFKQEISDGRNYYDHEGHVQPGSRSAA